MKTQNKEPWKFLEEYRGEFFKGEWPTLPELLEITKHRYPDNFCYTVFNPREARWTYKEALEEMKRVALYLKSKGIKKGDKVAVCGENSPEWAFAYMGTLFAGAVIVPLDSSLHLDEIKNFIDISESKFLFTDKSRFDKVQDWGIETACLSEKKERYIFEETKDFDFSKFKMLSIKDSDNAAILFTSGTTGNAKGVVLSHRNIVSDCFVAQGNMNIYPTDVFYALLPIHHSYTMLAVFIESMSVGANTVFGKRIVTTQIFKDLKKGKVTMFLGVPMLFNKLIKGILSGVRDKGIIVYGIIKFLMWISGFIKKTFKVNPGKKMFKGILSKVSLENIRICICGGGPLPATTFRDFNRLGINFVQGYGLTETSPIVALNPVEHYKEESVGKILPMTECKILEPDVDGIGEIALKGPMVMQGYYKNKKATDEVLMGDGFIKTGDLGYLDSENYLYLTGRAKSLIVTDGGKNVFPEEIENKFQLYEEIEQVMVRGYLEDNSEKIEVLIYPTQDFSSGASSVNHIKEHMQNIVNDVNNNLQPYKRINKVTLLDAPLEMTSTKKIKRFAVK